MYCSKDGRFENTIEDTRVVSQYSGSFSAAGIAAICNDVIAKGAEIGKHWVWHQMPDPDTGISPDGVNELIKRYQTMHVSGLCAIGICNTNVLIKAVKLPHDGSIKIPFKVSKDRSVLLSFFDEALEEAKLANTGPLQQSIYNTARNTQVLNEFLLAATASQFTEEEIIQLTGYPSAFLANDKPLLAADKLVLLQSLTAFLGVIGFQRNYQIAGWLRQEQEALGGKPPIRFCFDRHGLYRLFRLVNE